MGISAATMAAWAKAAAVAVGSAVVGTELQKKNAAKAQDSQEDKQRAASMTGEQKMISEKLASQSLLGKKAGTSLGGMSTVGKTSLG